MSVKIRIGRWIVKPVVIVAILLVALAECSLGAFEFVPLGPRSTAFGGAGVAIGADGFSGLNNPALVGDCDDLIGIAWSREFGIPELSRGTLAVSRKVGGVGTGLTAATFGSDLYRESSIDLLISRAFGDFFSAGMQVGTRMLDIASYSAGSAVSVTAGLLIQPFDGTTIGTVWRNLNRPELSGYSGKLPESLTIGFCTVLPEKSLVAVDIVQERESSAEYRLGVESEVVTGLALRIGMRAEPVRPSAGFEVSKGRWRVAYAGDLHPELGASHVIGLTFDISK